MKTLTLLSILLIAQDPDPAKVDEWVRQLTHEDIATREAATKSLVELGEKVLPLLEKHEKVAEGELKARLAGIRNRLIPISLDGLFKIAEEALKADAKVEDWRPGLTRQVAGIFELLGDSVPAKRRERIKKAVADSLAPGLPIVRKVAKDYTRAVVILDKATGEDVKGDVLLICRTCEVEDIRDSVVICLGEVKIRETSDALILANGDVEATREIDPSAVLLTGRLKSADIEDTLILALKGVETKDSIRNVYLNGTKRATTKSKDDIDVEKKGLPAPAK